MPHTDCDPWLLRIYNYLAVYPVGCPILVITRPHPDQASSLINAIAFDDDYVARQRQIRNAKQIEPLGAGRRCW